MDHGKSSIDSRRSECPAHARIAARQWEQHGAVRRTKSCWHTAQRGKQRQLSIRDMITASRLSDIQEDDNILIEYESNVGRLISGHTCICVCQYDRRRFTAAVHLHVLATHALSIVEGSVRENPFYMATPDLLHDEPPQTVLRRCLDELSKRSIASLSDA
jgi:hypothetical protein